MQSKTSYRLTAKYALLQGLYWGSFGAILAFASIFLLSRDFSNTQIGLFFTISNSIAFVLQPLIASMSDKTERISLRGILLFFGGLILLSSAVLYLLKTPALTTAVLFCIIIISLQTMQPFVNALGFALNTEKKSINYGIARSAGSFLYACLVLSLGSIVTAVGTQVLLLAQIVLGVAFLVVCFFFPASARVIAVKADKKVEDAAQPSGVWEFAKNNRIYLLFLLGVALVFTCYNICMIYLAQLIKSLGGNSTTYGIAVATASLLEVPIMIFFSKIVKRISCNVLLKISSVFTLLKAACYLLASNLLFIFLGQSMQIFGYALFASASVYYVDMLFPPQDKTKGHAFMTSAVTAGAIVGPLLGGWLLDNFGMSSVLMISVILCGAGVVFYLAAAQNPTVNATE